MQALLHGLQLFFYNLLKHLKRLRPGNEDAVYQKSRRASHSQRLHRERFLGNPAGVFAGVQALAKSGGIKPCLPGQFSQAVGGKAAARPNLIDKNGIMIGPKLALVCRAFAGFGRTGRFRPQNGKMFVGKAYLAGANVLFADSTQRVDGPAAAVGSLEIAEFNQSDGRIGLALKVAGIRQHKVHDGGGGGGLSGVFCRLGLRYGIGGNGNYNFYPRLGGDHGPAQVAKGQPYQQRRGHGKAKQALPNAADRRAAVFIQWMGHNGCLSNGLRAWGHTCLPPL